MTSPSVDEADRKLLRSITQSQSRVLRHLRKEKIAPVRSLRVRPLNFLLPLKENRNFISRALLYCIVSIHLYSASCSADQSEALPVRETHGREKRAVLRERKEALGSPVNKVDRVSKEGVGSKLQANDCEGSCLSHRSPRSRDQEIMTVK